MQQPTQSESDNIYEVRFKNTRKEFFRNVNALPLITGDFVVVESDRGFDVGQISLGGILARLQMRKRKVRADNDRMRKIYRRATREDVEKLQKTREREQDSLVRTREIIRELDLEMKLSDVEFQGDATKAIFYYIADTRVDFRELIKRLANEFRVRVEMKQIGLRHESGLVGGIGSCGRELCCATWLTDFKTVSTAAARYQNLSLNPMKISGQCGRLKCCLNFELDSYMDALKDIPKIDRIETETGIAYLQKTDIFKRIMWFSYQGESTWIAVATDKVRQLNEMNRAGIKPASLQVLDVIDLDALDKKVDFVDVVGQSVLREDPKRKKKKKKRPGEQAKSASQSRPPRAEGEQRPPRGEGGEQRERGPRPEGEQRDRGPRPPRPEGEQRNNRGPRPEGEQRERGPRPQSERRGPRPEGGEGRQQNERRGPRPEGEQRGPRPEGEQRGPRPEGEQRGRNQRGGNRNRPEGEPRAPRPEGEQRGPRPEGGEGQNRRPPRNDNNRREGRPPRDGRPGNDKPATE
jgi:cell fate regulator YaaT (PSP1 superfamily)